MVKAVYKGKVLAESNETIKVEGNHYFPIESINKDLINASELQTTCVWKGVAHYYHLKLDDENLKDMVWYYPEPKDAAKEIKGRIAFYQKDGVEVIEE